MNKYALDAREDNLSWRPRRYAGVGPSRANFLLSEEVIAGSTEHGFHRNELPLLGQWKKHENQERYQEFQGFNCANRNFRVCAYESTNFGK